MQVYKKWSERKFFESYASFQKGTIKVDPSLTWFVVEMRHLDEHIIPLCKEMQRLGCFGNSADEYLALAMDNKAQLSRAGPDIVRKMVDRYHGREEDKNKMTQRVSLSAY